MSLTKTWYTLEEAESKFGVERKTILEWVENGLVRSEQESGAPLRVDADDLELQIGDIAAP